MSASTTRRSNSVETAKLTPMSVSPLEAKIADIMPTRRPCASTSAPPDTPGFEAASVWTEVLDRVESGVGHVERGNHAAGHGKAEAERVADRAYRLRQPRRGRDPDRREPGIDAEHGDVARGVLRNQSRRQDAPVRKTNVDPSGGFDHVPGRRDMSRAQDHAASFRRCARPPSSAPLGASGPDGQHRNHRLQRVGGQRACGDGLNARESEQKRNRQDSGGGRGIRTLDRGITPITV